VDFDKWNELKKEINKKKKFPNFHEREIWFMNVGRNIGIESNGKGSAFLRPVLVLRKFNKEQFLGVMLTTKCKNNQFYYKLKDKSCILLSQIRIFSSKRLLRIMHKLKNEKFEEIKNKIFTLHKGGVGLKTTIKDSGIIHQNNQNVNNIANLKEAFKNGIYGSEFEKKLAIYSAKVLSNFLNGKNVLELGAGFGHTTKEIAKVSKKITVVDIEQEFLDLVDIECQKVCVDWLKFKSDEKFSDIVLFRGIDYMKEPSKLLKHIKTFMDKDSKLHILVPNNHSIHRLVGFYAGLDNPFELSQNDINVGHLHSFNLESLIYLLQKEGFKIIHQEGIGFKPLSNSQMDKLDENIQEAFIKMGNLFIQNSAEVYLVCKL